MKADKTDINYIKPYQAEWKGKTYKGIIIGWCSNIGWGECNISIDDDDNIEVDTETRCNNEDKRELELILDKTKEYILQNCKITG